MPLIIALLLLILASPAFAMSDSLIDYCLSTANPKACVHDMLQEERQAFQDRQAEQRQHELDLARQQALGFALFGSGPAALNGMNQGFQSMQMKPIQVAPPQPILLSPLGPTH